MEASASWSDALRVPQSAEAMWPAAAVNARGDVAVAWIHEGRSQGHATLRVRAAIRPAGAARFSVRTLVARRDLAARGTAVALDARGELTVAWIEQASDNGRTHGRKTVRAAYRTPGGRWSRVQAIGRSSAFNFATPRLAATADGTVVLTYNAHTNAAPGVAAAWRSRGRPFGSPQSVPTDGQYLFDPDPRRRSRRPGVPHRHARVQRDPQRRHRRRGAARAAAVHEAHHGHRGAGQGGADGRHGPRRGRAGVDQREVRHDRGRRGQALRGHGARRRGRGAGRARGRRRDDVDRQPGAGWRRRELHRVATGLGAGSAS